MITRRRFVKQAIIGIVAVAVGGIELMSKVAAVKKSDAVIVDRSVDPPIIMKEHSPKPEAKYGMVIDCRKCIGCHSCSAACRDEYNVPPGVWRSWVKVIEKGKGENKKRYYLPRLCNHCDEAPCVTVCPVKASYRREDGSILIRYDRCIGCKYCIVACPYDARFVHPIKGTVDKCTFCVHRVDKGMKPACVEICPVEARIFGDLNDPKSEISKIIATTPTEVLKPEHGTEPKVFYINPDKDIMGRIKISDKYPEAVKNYESTIPKEVMDAFEKYKETIY